MTPGETGAQAQPATSPTPSPTHMHRLHLWQFQAIRDLLVIAGLVLLVMCGYWLRSVTVPLLIALTLAYLLEPVVVRLCRHPRLTRPMVVGGMVALLAVSLVAVAIPVMVLLVGQTVDLAKASPAYIDRVIEFAEPYLPEGLLPESLLPAADSDKVTAQDGGEQPIVGEGGAPGEEAPGQEGGGQFEQWAQENLSGLFAFTVQTAEGAIAVVIKLVGSAVYAAFLLFLIPFYFYFFSTSWIGLRDYVHSLMPPESSPGFYELLGKMDLAVSGFVRGRIVISLIMGVMLAVGWAICGVPYWLVIGLITGILSAVPYLGGVGLPVAVILLWLNQGRLDESQQMAWWGILLWPTLVFGIVQLFEGYGLTPMIAGKSTNLGPVSILVAVLAGGVVMGVYGMLLAIPVMACVKILCSDVLVPRIRDWARGRTKDILPIDAGWRH